MTGNGSNGSDELLASQEAPQRKDSGSTEADIWDMLAGSCEEVEETPRRKDSSSTDADIWDMLAGSCEEVEERDSTSLAPAPASVLEPERQPVSVHHAAETSGGCCKSTVSVQHAAETSGGCCKSTGDKADKAGGCCGGGGAPKGFVRRTRARGPKVPKEIAEDAELLEAIALGLPSNYEFELPRTVWRLRRAGVRHVGLQLPEGLTAYATAIADILRDFVPTLGTCTILGDVTFGACCIDDLAGQAVGCDFLVHYGHSCLVPTDQTTLTTLYIHVEVDINVPHLVETVRLNFASEKKINFMGSVQFTSGTLEAVAELQKEFFDENGGVTKVPQVKPLGMGETLGCTSPHVEADVDAVIFVCDGRFHLESAMIQNPHVQAKDGFFRYDPLALTLTRESYGHGEMHTAAKARIKKAKKATLVGLILGTLGRQGSTGVLEEVERVLESRGVDHMTLLLSEVSPERLALFRGVGAWVQVCCPRLSLDWGEAFDIPLLTPYEAHIAFGDATYQDIYPMDYYSNKGGPWSNYGAHNGFGGTQSQKFKHMRRNRWRLAVEYEETEA